MFKINNQTFNLVFFLALLSACNYNDTSEKNIRPTFKPAIGTQYTEIRREFDNGIAFNQYGFQQEPEWILQFLAEDSVKIYSPTRKKFIHYHVYFDHDSVFNMAREWLRLTYISKDSLIFQLLQVEDKQVLKDRSNVLMKFYSEPYLKRIKVDPKDLQQPRKQDSVYIRSLIAKTSRNPENPDSSFAARKPVILKSKSDAITIEESNGAADPLNPSKADVYLNPEFKITIKGAYKNFSHNFTVLVDANGKIRLGKFNVSDEFRESRTRVLKGIINVYLQRYLKIIPGSTLGMAHNSEIMIYLKGIK